MFPGEASMKSRRPQARFAVALAAGALAAAGIAALDDARAVPQNELRILVAEGEGQQYWPNWRGPSGQGLVAGSGYPDTWSDTDNVLWKTPVPGVGHSSPIVWGDRIFLTTSYDNGTRMAVLAFDRATGEAAWETPIPFISREHIHDKNSHASATAVTNGERVFASFGQQGLVAVDFDGNLLWHRQIEDLDNYHGSAGSPILYEHTVIIYQDHRGASFVAALDQATGDVVWRRDREASTGWGTPIVIDTGERHELIVSSQATVDAYEPATGEPYWSVSGNMFEVIPTPVVGHGLVFASSGRAGPTFAIRPGGSGDVTDSHVAWKTQKGSPFVPSPIVVDEYLFMMNDMMSIVTNYEAATGRLVYQGRLGSASREGFSASPVALDGKVFFTNDEGQTFVLEVGPEFKLLHVNELNARTLATPALVDGMWYFRTATELIAIGN
jgi:outer membrane protein assembly factor BamB